MLNGNQNSRYGAIARYLPPTLGKVFFVTHADNANLNSLLTEFPTDSDGVPRVYQTVDAAATDNLAVQAALDATVAGRNDYVIIMPGNGNDYDLGAVLTMTKNDVHLVTLESLTAPDSRIGCSRQVVLEQTASADVVNITGMNCEFAGFYIKPYANKTSIATSSNPHGYNIHHNMIYMTVSTTMTEYVIDCHTDSSGIYGRIANNWFTSQSGTCAGCIMVGTSATGNHITRNMIVVGDSATLTAGIYAGGYKGLCDYNTVSEMDGGGAGGTITMGFENSGSVMNRNIANIANDDDFTSAGTNDYVANWCGAINKLT